MSKSSREYIREYQRRYRAKWRCHGRDHVPTVVPPADDEARYPPLPTEDEIRGAKEALMSAHRLRAIGVRQC